MTSFVLPLTIRSPGRDVDLLVELSGPTCLADVLPELTERAGLRRGAALHLGAGAVQGSWTLGRAPLLAGCVLSTTPVDGPAARGPVNLSCVAGPDAGGWTPLDERGVIVGREPGCDLRCADPELSRLHARISATDQGIVVTDLDSTNGVRVDGLPSSNPASAVPMGTLIRLGGSVFRASFDAEPAMLAVPDGAGHLLVARPARIAPQFDHPDRPAPGPAPERGHRPIPLFAAGAGAAAGLVIAVVTGMWTFLLLAALGPLMMLASTFADRIGGRRSHRRAQADHRAALALEAEHLDAAIAADRTDAWDRFPDPATLARRAVGCGSRLWERRRGRPDFLLLSLGIGQRPGRLSRSDPPMVAEVPITVDLANVGVLGVAGACRPLVRHLLCQLAGLHSPVDVRLAVFSDADDLTRCRDLPHTAVGGALGALADPTTAAREVARLLSNSDGGVAVVVLDDAARWRRIPRMNELLVRAARIDQALVAICVSSSAAALPVECAAVAVVDRNLVRLAACSTAGEAEVAGVSPQYLDDLVGALASLVDPDAPGAGLPRDLGFSSLLAPDGVAESMARQWLRPTASAVIGAAAGGPLMVDLERDGPHLLIAGTTGSGKSELLQTLITGLACAAPPDHTAFLLIDYKGGAAFGRLIGLPHTTGVITDLDESLGPRALISLQAEVRRREKLLADAGAVNLAAWRGHGAAFPSLVIVVDEFATLSAERPEFLTGLLDVAQRGRSLGLHLILATQRPAGVLNAAMKANIGLRICLRVADDADSVDVVDTVQAARLTPNQPGRAVLRRSRSSTTVFQVARVSVPPSTGHRVLRRDGHRPPVQRSESGRSDLDEVISCADRLSAATERPLPPWLPPLPALFEPVEPELIALVDRPHEQSQVGWRSPSLSTMVLGPPGSGRSTALRRIAYSAASAGADLLLVDAGGGLRDVACWPASRTHLTGEDVALVQRLVAKVAAELRLRAESAGPPVVLLIDGWRLISGSLDALDYGATATAVADLAARGPTVGIRVVVSGDPDLEHHRMAGSFASVLRLGVDGDPRPGRGLLGTDEAQVAHCDPGTRPPAEPASSVAAVRRPIVVCPLPTRVALSELPPATADAVPLGLGGDAAAPQAIDLSGPGGGLLVAGPRRSGVSTTLSVLAVGAAAAGIRVVRGCLRPGDGLSGVQDIDLRSGMTPLRNVLSDHRGPVLLVADDADGWPEDGAELLERFVAVAGTGQYLALGCRLDRALRVHRGPVAEVAALRTGVLLQPDAADGGLLDARTPRRTGPIWAGRGYLVRLGSATPIQVAAPEPGGDHRAKEQRAHAA